MDDMSIGYSERITVGNFMTNINHMIVTLVTVGQCTLAKDTVLRIHILTHIHPVLWNGHDHIEHYNIAKHLPAQSMKYSTYICVRAHTMMNS